jgi:fructose-6-phosphate aldolase 2
LRSVNNVIHVRYLNLEDIKKGYELYPVCGVTTNPSILAKERKPVFEHLNEIRKIIEDNEMLQVQALERYGYMKPRSWS